MTQVDNAFQLMREHPPPLTKAMRSPRPSPRRLALLGATGSIGRQVCDLVERHPDRFTLHALVAGSDAGALDAVARRHPEAHALLAHGAGADPVRAGRAIHEAVSATEGDRADVRRA